MSKKLISCLLVLALVIALVPATVLAAPATTVSDAAGLKDAIDRADKVDAKAGVELSAATEIVLSADVTWGFDIGDSSGEKAQNIVIDLGGNTLTLDPAVGSTGTVSNGLRVLAYSSLTIKNGTVACTGTGVKVGMANYGTLILEDVEVLAGDNVQLTINNRGDLTLKGNTSVENGKSTEAGAYNVAVTNDPYDAFYEDRDATLTVADDTVAIGDIMVERYERREGVKNKGSVVLNLSAGSFGEVKNDGETAVEVEGNISGGSFAVPVDPTLFADGYDQLIAEDGTVTVMTEEDAAEQAVSIVTVTQNGEKVVLYFANSDMADEVIEELQEDDTIEIEVEKFYTVTFIVDGTTVSEQKVAENAKLAAVTAPTKDGYTFAGWVAGDKAYDVTAPVTADATVEASWTKNPVYYTVTFIVDGKTVSTQEVEEGAKLAAVTAPTKDGYTFVGWMVGDKAYDMDSAVNADLTLTASFVENPKTGDNVTMIAVAAAAVVVSAAAVVVCKRRASFHN